MNAPEADPWIERLAVLRGLPPALRVRVAAEGQLRQAAAGERLFAPRQPCEGFPLVLQGSVRVSSVSPGGREIVLYRVEAGEACVLSGGCLLGRMDHAATGVAETAVRVLRLPPPLFHELLAQSDAFRRFVFDAYGTRLAEVLGLVEEVAFRKLDTRLARLLVQRGPVVGATHQALADELGSVRVFVSRLLRSFADRGWVRLERERVTLLDAPALAGFARGD